MSRFFSESRLKVEATPNKSGAQEDRQMTRYVFIESRDPFDCGDSRFVEETAVAVKERGHDVTVFLVQNGVLAARRSARRLGRLAEAGVTVLADDFSLRERGIKTDELAPSIRESGIDALVDAIVQKNTKALWH
jgi:predicted peroxiredoxin